MECAACLLLMARLDRAQYEYARSFEHLSAHLARANRQGYRVLLDRVKAAQNEFDFVAHTVRVHQARHPVATVTVTIATSDTPPLQAVGMPVDSDRRDELLAIHPHSAKLVIIRARAATVTE